MSTASEIFKRLDDNLQTEKLTVEEQEALLAQLKVFSRQPNVVQQHFTFNAIVTLSTYGLRRSQSAEALRCLANAIFLVESHRQLFVDKGFAVDAAELLKTCDYDHEFLLCRIIFLLTYKTNLDFSQLDQRKDLCTSITRLCQRHAEQYASRSGDVPPQQTQALVETLKLLFNTTYFFPSLSKRFETAIKPIISLLLNCPLPTPPLQPPIASLINVLLNVDLDAAAQVLGDKIARGSSAVEGDGVRGDASAVDQGHKERPKAGVQAIVDRLIDILGHAVQEHAVQELDTLANPLCTLLRRICEVGDVQLRQHMRATLLPQNVERDKPLGKSETLAAHLLRLSVSAELPTLGNNISSLLFELSDKDPGQFVHNVGYGYASGHLLNNGMAAPLPTSSPHQSGAAPAVNPITGQNLDRESQDAPDPSEMTDEEKEREAERLFVLFERLKATGVIDVKNPVERLYKDAD